MKSATSARTVSPAEFDTRLNSYSKTALAVAAAGALGTTSDAAAQAVVHNLTVDALNTTTLLVASPENLVVSQGGFHVEFMFGGPDASSRHGVRFGGSADERIAGYINSAGFADRLNSGDKVQSRGWPAEQPLYLAFRADFRDSVGGQFRGDSHTGYVGFKRVVSGQTYFGWLRLRVDFDGNGDANGITLLPKEGTSIYGAYALGGISVGDVAAAAVPEPAQVATGLGLLALGAAGVRELRKRVKGGAR